MLRKYPFFKLEVVVGSGRDLIAMDRGGKSFLGILFELIFYMIQCTGYLLFLIFEASPSGLLSDSASPSGSL